MSHPTHPEPVGLRPGGAGEPPHGAAPAAVRDLAACALLSAQVLLAQVALTRLLSVTLYYHYAFVVVALALAALGWGARGIASQAAEGERRAAAIDACSGAATALLLYSILLLVVPWRPFVGPTASPEGAAGGFLAGLGVSLGRWLAPLELALLVLLAAVPFAFAGRGLASLFAAGRGRAAGLRASEAAGGALVAAAAGLLIGGLTAPGALLAAALLASLAGLVLLPSADGSAAAPAGRGRALALGAGAALCALLSAAGTLAPLPPLHALSRARFGLREAAGPLFVGALVLVVELLAALPGRRRALRGGLQAGGIGLLLLLQLYAPVLRIRYVKGGHLEAEPLREEWTLDSRVALQSGNVFVDGAGKTNFAWGLSRAGAAPVVDQLQIQLDALSASPMMRFRGNLTELDYLRYDITSLAFRALQPGADVLVVGAGGGRDILAGLVFGAGRVTGIESNPHIVRWVCAEYAAFTGRLCDQENVRMERAEARAWLARSHERFDLIQVSFADTWGAGPAGAYALTENFLYTREALRSYLDHLKDDGLLSFSHYAPRAGTPIMERLFLTAVEALEEGGAREPAGNLLLAVTPDTTPPVATLIVRPRPFSPEELRRLGQAALEQGFVILYPGGGRAGEAFAELAAPAGRAERVSGRGDDIRPAEDDRPFFFLTSRWWSPRPEGAAAGALGFHANAMAALAPVALIGTLAALGGAALRPRRRALQHGEAGGAQWGMARLGFFLLCGFAFVAAELAMGQRLALLLGGPGSALTVVLAVFLAASALGAALAQRGIVPLPASVGLRPVAAAAALVLLVVAAALPWLIAASLGLRYALRLAVALGALLPCGFLLGLLGALGLRAAEAAGEEKVAAAWGASALGAAAAGALGWWVAVWVGYSAVLLLAVAAVGGALGLAGRLSADAGAGRSRA